MKKFINHQFKKLALSAAGLPILNRLNRESKNIRAAQSHLLHSFVTEGKSTQFGKEHSFNSIKTIEDFRKAVPIRDFEGFRPYIDKMCNGERDILFPGKPLFYNTTLWKDERLQEVYDSFRKE